MEGLNGAGPSVVVLNPMIQLENNLYNPQNARQEMVAATLATQDRKGRSLSKKKCTTTEFRL